MTTPLIRPPPDPSRFKTPADYSHALYKWTYEIFRRLTESGLLPWALVDKTGSDIADLATKSHTSLADIGTNTHAQLDTAATASTSHIAATAAHGVSGNIVGTTDIQTLTNKSISGEQIDSGTVADARIASTIARDSEVTADIGTHAALTATHGVVGAIVGTTDDQALSVKDITLKGATDQLGTTAVLDAAAATATTVTDNTGGTAGGTVENVTAAFDQTVLNNNFAELAKQVSALVADAGAIRTQLNTLLGELRMTNGCGVLSD